MDFHLTNVVGYDTEEARRLLLEMGFGSDRVSLDEQFHHRFLISMDGNGGYMLADGSGAQESVRFVEI